MIFIKAFIKCYPYLVGIAIICFVCYSVWISKIYYDILLTAVPLWMLIAYGAILSVAVIAVLTVIYIILLKCVNK